MQQDIFHHILKIILMSRRFINSAWHCVSLVIMLLMNVMQRINIRYRKIKPENRNNEIYTKRETRKCHKNKTN